MIKTFEKYKDIDPYGEENWDDKPIEITKGYNHIRMLDYYNINLEYGHYDDDDYYVEDFTEELDLEIGEELWVDVLDVEGDNVYVTMDTGHENVGRGILPKNVFRVI